MTNDNYVEFVQSRFKRDGIPPLLHAVIGISGEAGELLDAVKKHVVYNKPLDVNNVIEELGDLLFYIQAAASEVNTPMSHIIKRNVEKLTKRYPTTYTDELAQARLDKQDEKVRMADPYFQPKPSPVTPVEARYIRVRHVAVDFPSGTVLIIGPDKYGTLWRAAASESLVEATPLGIPPVGSTVNISGSPWTDVMRYGVHPSIPIQKPLNQKEIV